MSSADLYEVVVGLEVHAQLLTQTKLFCGDSISFGAEPNTHISPITLAHPGTLPKLNKKALEMAVKMGIACHCEIEKHNYFARKNYFYPDLPKGYQVSQHTTPICKSGYIKIKTTSGEKTIRLNRIHLEEDAGKSLHDADDLNTCIDYNRAGTPLIEIVTEPDLRSGEEAFAFLTQVRRLVRYLDICDGNMEEGSLRCDANISVRKKGEAQFGTKVEIKNLNSIRNVKRAIEAEAIRLMNILDQGGEIMQQTRGFDAVSGNTFTIREKEDADDYRYFPEPDLTPFNLQNEFVEKIGNTIPALPEERIKEYISAFSLSEYDAAVITDERDFADYFEEILQHTKNCKAAANWMMGPVKSWLNEKNCTIKQFPVAPKQLASVINMIDEGKLSFSVASTRLFEKLLQTPGKTPEDIAIAENLISVSDLSFIGPLIDKTLDKFASKVIEYKKGKKGLLSLFVGEVMKHSRGKADPETVNKMILEKINKQ
ncbi:MAG: Asp-tRNA(Asn)/Glu-tRNA(Gln) amidotransferase subunit GatB [Sphingobacteriales bacterium]|nr:Asp-tRNA(Asn)/Glu-tRNA(Gln) amidotransferase subunit GatB [Sphingobacteriales bacterium]